MIEINLLPQELRKKPSIFSMIKLKELDIKSIPVFNIAAGIGAAVILIQLTLFLIGMISGMQLSSASRRYDAISADNKEALALKAKVADINKRSSVIDELMAKRFSWAKKINALSDYMTPGIWLSDLYYDERPISDQAKATMPGALVISGYASGVGEQGAALIGKFIKSLQDSKAFYSGIDSIDLVSTKSEKVDNQDVMSFRITCLFK